VFAGVQELGSSNKVFTSERALLFSESVRPDYPIAKEQHQL
jgi:hypothetical protein